MYHCTVRGSNLSIFFLNLNEILLCQWNAPGDHGSVSATWFVIFLQNRWGTCRRGQPPHCGQVRRGHGCPSGQCWQGQTFGSVASPWTDLGILPDLPSACLTIDLSVPPCLLQLSRPVYFRTGTIPCSITLDHPRLLSDSFHFLDFFAPSVSNWDTHRRKQCEFSFDICPESWNPPPSPLKQTQSLHRLDSTSLGPSCPQRIALCYQKTHSLWHLSPPGHFYSCR